MDIKTKNALRLQAADQMVEMHRHLIEAVHQLYPAGHRLMVEQGIVPNEPGMHMVEFNGGQMKAIIERLVEAEREGIVAVLFLAWMFTASVDSVQHLGPPEVDPDNNTRSN